MFTLEQESLATLVASKFDEYKGYRSKREGEWEELRKYLFATSTRDTTNNKLPWRNSTTRPKLTQIRDNLHANYMAAEFSSDEWLEFQPGDETSSSTDKVQAAEKYMYSKTQQVDFESFISQALLDWIDYGMVFAGLSWARESYTDIQGEEVIKYVGAKPYRISPYDIVFDPTAEDFKKTPKIIRKVKTLGSLILESEQNPDMAFVKDHLDKIKAARGVKYDLRKNRGFEVDGFGSIQNYMDSGMVELLEYTGDLYNATTGEVLQNRRIVVIDRAHVVLNEPIKSWNGSSYIYSSGWRKRPDNLWSMGCLDNLVGMQYRIDHLENLKADVFDMVAFPITIEKGDLEFDGYYPGARAYLSDEADLGVLKVDSQALNADIQIAQLEQSMEEMAGAPKSAMGLRTPGEKTAFEVNSLDAAANRIFLNKVAQFEKEFLEPMLNDWLEMSRRMLDGVDVIKSFDTELGIESFIEITRDDLTSKGKLKARGARHLAYRNQRIQELTTYNNSILQDPGVRSHISSKKIAKLTSELMGEEGLYGDNIQVVEQLETQKMMQLAQNQLEEDSMAAAQIQETA
jgi:hypothetical protein